MTCNTNSPTRHSRSTAAFTMVEIVLSLSVIAIAMVAIIGVLPLGMNVQTENRETSIINTDAGIWIEAIRTGAQGMEYLTSFVMEVGIHETRRRVSDGGLIDETTEYVTSFTSASNLIGILSYPKYRLDSADPSIAIERNVYADVRAMNGTMGDLIADNDFAFNYRLTPELVPKTSVPSGPFPAIMQTSLFDLRMKFAWPLVVGTGGDYRLQSEFFKDITFRTMVSGDHQVVENPDDVTRPFYFVNPRHYAK
jgi:hypothetical protein